MKNRQQGSAAVVVLLCILLALLGLAFWWIWSQNKDNDNNDSDDSKNNEQTSITVKDVGFMTPESVLYDPADDVYLVSNINGAPLQEDDNGFISRVSPDGTVMELKWIDGASGDFNLDAPKGLAISGDELYVADIDVVQVFSRTTGEFVRTIAVAGATFLNDVAAGTGEGTLYVSDSGLNAEFKTTGTDAIYKVTGGDQVATLVKDTGLMSPNGIAVHSDGEQLMVASYGSNKIFHVNADGTFSQSAELPEGSLDGLVWRTVGATMLVSSWDAGAIYSVDHSSGEATKLFENMPAPADIGYDTSRNRVLVPLFNDNTVEIRKVN